MQLGIAELLLEHELVEILSRVGLTLQCLQSLRGKREDQPNPLKRITWNSYPMQMTAILGKGGLRRETKEEGECGEINNHRICPFLQEN